tara:strand:+ start:7565 stop:8155 length:591 start_codon:yes stop_codon:yes gene_type:complete
VSVKSGDVVGVGEMDGDAGDVAGESDMVCVTATAENSFVPAYRMMGEGTGPQCAAHGQFCFFCTFSESPDGTENSLVTDLKELARQLSADRREVETIAEAIQNAYREMVQEDVEWTKPDGTVVASPEWSKLTIERHLLFSSEFEDLFDSNVDRIFHSLIYRLNEKAINAVDMSVDKENHAMLMTTIKNYRQWRGKR